MLQRRRSQRTYSLTTAYTGVQSPPPNAIAVSPAARAAAAASAGNSRSNSMSSTLSSAAAAAALKRHNSLTQDSMAAMEAASAQPTGLTRRGSTASGRAGSLVTPPAVVVSPPTELKRSASSSSHRAPPRTSVQRTRNPDRSESLTTTTVRRLGSFELTSTKVINLPSPRAPPHWGRAAPPSPQTSTSSGGLSGPRKPYASSLLSFESDLEPVTEEEGIDQRLRPGHLKFNESPAPLVKHRPPPRALSPIKPALKDSSRTASIASENSTRDDSPKRHTRVSFSGFDDDTPAPESRPAPKVQMSEGANAKLRYQRQQMGIANAAKMAYGAQAAASGGRGRGAAAASSSAAAIAASSLQRSNSSASARGRQRTRAVGNEQPKDEDSDNDSVYSDAFEDINDRSIDDTLAAAAAAAAKPARQRPAAKSAKSKEPPAKSNESRQTPAKAANPRGLSSRATSTPVKTLRQNGRASFAKPAPKFAQPPAQALPSPPVSPVVTNQGAAEGLENGAKKTGKVFRFNAFKPKRQEDNDSDDADAESVGSESSWKRERQERRRSSAAAANGGGFSGFRKSPVEEPVRHDKAEKSTPSPDTEDNEPAPLADGLTAEQLAAIMYKRQMELEKQKEQAQGRSSFERNDASSSGHFKFNSMRSQNGSAAAEPHSESTTSQFRSRFEDSDSDDDYALPPLPEHRAFLEKPKHVNTGNSSAASKIKEVFSPSKEAKILIPHRKSSAGNLKPITEDSVMDPPARNMANTLRERRSRSSNKKPEPVVPLRTGGLADDIAPRRKKKFSGLRKVFGLTD